MHRRIAGAVAAALLVAFAAPGAQAQNADPQLLTISCAGCHGPGGKSPGPMPALNGRSAQSLAELMRAFRADQRPATVMNRIAKGYSDAEIDAVAREIATAWK
ncbi:MAG: c-type cytochrome [Pseudomonadota bacterium]